MSLGEPIFSFSLPSRKDYFCWMEPADMHCTRPPRRRLATRFSSNEYTPGDFSSENNLQLLQGSSLDGEAHITKV